MSDPRVISADSHVQEDPRLYQERIPKKFRHRVPHVEGTFPHSQEVIERNFAGVSESDKRKIVCGNAARLYGF